MNRGLQYANYVGVLSLAVLCVLQWQTNRRVNLEANRLEKIRIEQAAQIEDLSKKVGGTTQDLEDFRGQVVQANERLKTAETSLRKIERQEQQLSAENDQLKSAITNWSAAVNLRDERLKQANETLRDLEKK